MKEKSFSQRATSQVAIERARARDAGLIAFFRYHMFADMFPDEDYSPRQDTYIRDVTAYYEKHLDDRDQITVFAKVDCEKVGCGTIMFQERPLSIKHSRNNTAYILNIYVLPEYRKLGAATAIMKELHALADEAGVRRIGLHASVAGRFVYEKMGYHAKDNYLETEI